MGWEGKHKKEYFYKEDTEGGLKMVDVNSYNMSMKIKWLKKLVASGNGDCYIFINGIFDTQKLFNLGISYCKQIVKLLKTISGLMSYSLLLLIYRNVNLQIG